MFAIELPWNFLQCISGSSWNSEQNVKCEESIAFCSPSILLILWVLCSIHFCLLTSKCVFDVAIQSSVVVCFLPFFTLLCSFFSVFLALFTLNIDDNETNNTSQCQHGFKCVLPFTIPCFLFLYFFFFCSVVVGFIVVVFVLHPIFVDKCIMFRRLTLKWIQINKESCACADWYFEWLQRRIIIAYFRCLTLSWSERVHFLWMCSVELLNHWIKYNNHNTIWKMLWMNSFCGLISMQCTKSTFGDKYQFLIWWLIENTSHHDIGNGNHFNLSSMRAIEWLG